MRVRGGGGVHATYMPVINALAAIAIVWEKKLNCNFRPPLANFVEGAKRIEGKGGGTFLMKQYFQSAIKGSPVFCLSCSVLSVVTGVLFPKAISSIIVMGRKHNALTK